MLIVGTAFVVHFIHITRSGAASRITGSPVRYRQQNPTYDPQPPFVPGVRYKKKSVQVNNNLERKIDKILDKLEKIESLIDKMDKTKTDCEDNENLKRWLK
jgi:hypothetical protein